MSVRKIEVDSSDISAAIADLSSTANAITARAGGGQGSATPLTATYNRVTTVATAADSVLLPAAVAGSRVVAFNAAAANSMNVFPATGQFINALSVNTAFAVAAGRGAEFVCCVDGTWNTVYGA